MKNQAHRPALSVFGPLFAALLLCAAPLSAQAEPPGEARHKKGPAPHKLIEKHAETLGIDDTTLAEIQAIAEGAKEERRALRRAARQARQELHQMLESDEPEHDAVMRQVEVAGQAQIEARKHQLTVLMQIRALLTPAQRLAVRELMRRERPEHRRGEGPPRGMGR